MDFNVPPVGGVDGAGGPAPASRNVSKPEKSNEFSRALTEASEVDISVPATPPPELRGEVERASARYDELRAQQRELHFANDPQSGRLVIEVRDLHGNVIRTVAPSKALDVISGAPLEENG
jgi:flagellar protein FlaG